MQEVDTMGKSRESLGRTGTLITSFTGWWWQRWWQLSWGGKAWEQEEWFHLPHGDWIGSLSLLSALCLTQVPRLTWEVPAASGLMKLTSIVSASKGWFACVVAEDEGMQQLLIVDQRISGEIDSVKRGWCHRGVWKAGREVLGQLASWLFNNCDNFCDRKCNE